MSVSSTCPSCGQVVRISEDLLGKRLRCKKCSTIFVAQDDDSPFEEIVEADVIDEPPRVRRARRGEGDDWRPSGRRSAARATVLPLAITMMCLGGLGLVLYLLNLYLMQYNADLQRLSRQGGPAYRVGMIIGYGLGLIWPVVTIYGGFKLKSLQNYSSVWVAVIFMILPCNLGCLLGIPVGIWAMVVLLDQNVRQSFSS